MSLNYRSRQKLLRDHIQGHAPLRLSSDQATAFAASLVEQIEFLPGAKRNDGCFQMQRHTADSTGHSSSPKICGCILLENAPNRWYRNETHLHLLHNPEGQLQVELDHERSAPISNSDEILALVRAYHHRVEQQHARAVKRQKQRDLKYQAILAQVRKIAKEDQFDFATDMDSVKLNLFIRLSEDDYFVILIPFKRFKEVLPKLRTAIQALRETYNSGVRFKTRLPRHYGRSDWIRHQDL